jgi:hypothetical protein
MIIFFCNDDEDMRKVHLSFIIVHKSGISVCLVCVCVRVMMTGLLMFRRAYLWIDIREGERKSPSKEVQIMWKAG